MYWFDTQPLENLAWRSNLAAIAQDWSAGEVSSQALFEAVLEEATPSTASEALEVLGRDAASRFEHWFVARFGDSISVDHRHWVWVGRDGWKRKKRARLVEAFHRAILDRREPL